MGTVYALDHFIPIVTQWDRHQFFVLFCDERTKARTTSEEANQTLLGYVHLTRFYYLKPF